MPDPIKPVDDKGGRGAVEEVLKDMEGKLKDPPEKKDPPATAADIDRVRLNETAENVAWMTLEKNHGDLVSKHREAMNKELELYPPERRTPEILEKVLYMIHGRETAKPKAPPSSQPAGGGRPVVKTKVSEGYRPNDPGVGSGGPAGNGDGAAEEPQLSEEEMFVTNRLGVSPKDYARSKEAGRAIRSLEIPQEKRVANSADVELNRMHGNR